MDVLISAPRLAPACRYPLVSRLQEGIRQLVAEAVAQQGVDVQLAEPRQTQDFVARLLQSPQ